MGICHYALLFCTSCGKHVTDVGAVQQQGALCTVYLTCIRLAPSFNVALQHRRNVLFRSYNHGDL